MKQSRVPVTLSGCSPTFRRYFTRVCARCMRPAEKEPGLTGRRSDLRRLWSLVGGAMIRLARSLVRLSWPGCATSRLVGATAGCPRTASRATGQACC